MTVSELETAARQRYNAVGETFWSASEIQNLMYSACLELSTETQCIERVYTTDTTIGEQDYDFPTSTIAIKRVTYNGRKLRAVNMREDDALTLNNQSTAETGSPQYYTVWNYTISLRPIPDSVYALKIYSINEPQEITNTSILEVPVEFQMRLVNYMLSEMYAKDKDINTASYYLKKWEKDKNDIKRWMKLRKRTDSYARVMDEETLPETFLGAV
jgi:hypothetical protein